MTTAILGGGIAGLSLASLLDDETIVIEKEDTPGGLCRSFNFNGLAYDIGPHIIFSKHQEVLNLHNSMVPVEQHRRLNRILVEGSFLTYPLENDLGALPPIARDRCLQEFMNNPYEGIPATNMLQFFLSRFGEGMTDLYFYPYNKKIWKYDPSALDLQMVERIPSPPKEDVISGAQGDAKDGYAHQLFFTYPTSGGFQTIVDAYADRVLRKGHTIRLGDSVRGLTRSGSRWQIESDRGTTLADRVVSTIPLQLLPRIADAPTGIRQLTEGMKYNSIYIVIIQVRGDRLEDQFALYVPDADIIFHRLSRLNFLGSAYGGNDVCNLMAEVTFRPDSFLGSRSEDEIVQQCLEGLQRLGIAQSHEVIDVQVHTSHFAYVTYDLEHRMRTDAILDWARSEGIICHGRFGKFEYQNSDQVVFDSLRLAEQMNDIQ